MVWSVFLNLQGGGQDVDEDEDVDDEEGEGTEEHNGTAEGGTVSVQSVSSNCLCPSTR